MQRLTLAAVAAVALLLLGQGTLRAAGQPDASPQQNAGAAPGQRFGTSADVTAKKRLDEQKYQKTPAESAAGAQSDSASKQRQ